LLLADLGGQAAPKVPVDTDESVRQPKPTPPRADAECADTPTKWRTLRLLGG
jgi:hypothetical protein